ncbi:hypothetical protein A359_01810 [secondary endosymbiont of Ctenarytaina eucalypti]|uniref:Uncharacterized protein n=1 Tax=secondary endosymbiont of Ctenarytaina eucalypti TaxID=1199245 RepID=J3YRB9_9ENTR|nr:hypothetical protein A359_01810 [secondary endosymbiont of Ctenarytaina eucalypti]
MDCIALKIFRSGDWGVVRLHMSKDAKNSVNAIQQ